MSRAFGRVVDRMLKNNNGMVNGQPRIYNVDRGIYCLGYTEINQQATSTFSRIKTHKAWFSGNADVRDGDLILDRADNSYYLVMSVKAEFSGGIPAYIDGTVYFANTTCRIERFDSPTKNAFGRVTDSTPTVVAENVYIMSQSVTLNVTEHKDQDIADEKIKVAVQKKFDVRINDRLVTANGNVYKVNSIDDTQVNGLWTLFVGKDVR